MSSEFYPSISRNLVRVSGLGYRENIELHEFNERTQPSEVLVSRRAGSTDASIMLARFGDHPGKISGAAISASLSDLRETAIPQL